MVRSAVKALIVTDGHILLTKEDGGIFSDFWTLPGGGVEKNESDMETLQRELYEELAITNVEVGDVVGYCYYSHRSSDTTSKYTIYTVSLPILTEVTPNERSVVDVRWHPVDELPENCLQPISEAVQEITNPQKIVADD